MGIFKDCGSLRLGFAGFAVCFDFCLSLHVSILEIYL